MDIFNLARKANCLQKISESPKTSLLRELSFSFITRPDTRHKMRLVCILFTFKNNAGLADLQTDLPTDGWTDTTSYRDVTAHLKTKDQTPFWFSGHPTGMKRMWMKRIVTKSTDGVYRSNRRTTGEPQWSSTMMDKIGFIRWKPLSPQLMIWNVVYTKWAFFVNCENEFHLSRDDKNHITVLREFYFVLSSIV